MEVILEHYGVKGMRWGVRKSVQTAPEGPFKSEKITLNRDGSAHIGKGAELARLGKSSGVSLGETKVTFVSTNAADTAKYVKLLGGDGFLGGKRDQLISLRATKDIAAPNVKEATRIHSELMLRDPKFRQENKHWAVDRPINDKELAKIRADPSGKDAFQWYQSSNTKLGLKIDQDPSLPEFQKKMAQAYTSKGYGALRDENDVAWGAAKAPVIILNPASSLRVVSITTLTDEIRKSSRQEQKYYQKQGKAWVEKELYGT